MNDRITYLKKYAKDFIEKHPQHKEAVLELVGLCFSEIEEGGSVENEIQLCINDINQLIL